MARNRVYLVVVALLALMAGLGGVIGNIASARLPKSLDPYLWLAWPLFVLLTLSTVGLVLWQIRLERESSSEKESDKPPQWLPQLTDAVKAAMQPTGTPARPSVVHSTSQDGADEDSDFSGDYTYDVFVSHSQVDEAWVREELLVHLERAGLKVCLTDRDFAPGAPVVSETQRALENSRKTVVVLSQAYLRSEWANFEVLLLQTLDPANQERRLMPLLREACDLPVRLAYLVSIDFTQAEDQEAVWTRLLSAIGAVQPKQSRSDLMIHPVVPNNLPPRGHFVGRQAEKGLIQQALRSRVHLVSVEGPGGVGKTTLVLEVAHDCLTSSQNPVRASSWPRFAGFVWATAAGREVTLDDLLNTIAQTLNPLDILKEPPEQKRESVRKLLQSESYLIVSRQLRYRAGCRGQAFPCGHS